MSRPSRTHRFVAMVSEDRNERINAVVRTLTGRAPELRVTSVSGFGNHRVEFEVRGHAKDVDPTVSLILELAYCSEEELARAELFLSRV